MVVPLDSCVNSEEQDRDSPTTVSVDKTIPAINVCCIAVYEQSSAPV